MHCVPTNMVDSWRSLPRSIQIIAVSSLALTVVLALDLIPFLRGGEIFHWQWSYAPPALSRMLPLLLIVVTYLLGAWRLFHHRRSWLLLWWAVLGTIAISLAVIYLRFDDIFYQLFLRTVSGITTGPHLAGAMIDWSAPRTLHNWTAVMLDFDVISGHIALSPPGLPMFYGALNALLENFSDLTVPIQRQLLPHQCHNYMLLAQSSAEWVSSLFGMLMPLWAGLTVFPLAACARRISDGLATRHVVIWWALVPALVMFVPTWNTVFPLITVSAFYLFLVGLEKTGFASALWIGASGLVVGLLTFANFSMIPLAGVFGFYTLWQYFSNERSRDNPRSLTRPLLIGLWFGIGLISVWLLYYVISGVTPFEILDFAMGRHLAQERPYVPWVWFHFWEWVLFTGFPLILLWLWSAIIGRGNKPLLAWALLATMIVLLLSGTARGETGRVWLFFSPFVLLAAAHALSSSRMSQHIQSRASAVVTLVQAATMLAVAITIPVIDVIDFTDPPPLPEVRSANHTINAQFELLNLVGWSGSLAEDGITLTVNWQVNESPITPYWFAALLVADGNPVGQSHVWQPLDTHYPTTCWQPGPIISDQVTLPIPDGISADEWWISLSVFGDVDAPEDRLAVTLPDGSQDTQIGLGPIRKAGEG